MRLIKMFILAAIAAISAMAFVGASSASATFDTALCKEPSVNLACPTAQQATTVHFEDKTAELETPALTVVCEGLFHGTALPLGKPLVLHGLFKYANCKNGCTAVEKNGSDGALGGLILALKTGEDLATVSGHGFEVRVTCAGVIECDYTDEGLEGHGLSSNLPAHAGLVSTKEEPVTHLPKGLLDICPATASLTAEYEPLEDLWVRS